MYELYLQIKEFLQPINEQIIKDKNEIKRINNIESINRSQESIIEQKTQHIKKLEHKKSEKLIKIKKNNVASISHEHETKLRQQFLDNHVNTNNNNNNNNNDNINTDVVTFNKCALLLCHLLKKFSSLNATNLTEYNNNFTTLFNEIKILGINNKYFNNICENEKKFEHHFNETFNKFINKADVKKPIVNNFYDLQYNLKSDITTNNNSDNVINTHKSRYKTDYREIKVLGTGAFGHVMKCQHKIDQRYYAIKMIPINQRGEELKKILREVTTLSRMQGPYILRYYSAWFEADKSSELAEILNFHASTNINVDMSRTNNRLVIIVMICMICMLYSLFDIIYN